MERLTRRHPDGSVGINAFRYYNYNDFQKMAKRLADYEDIGTVEELKTMKENGSFSALEMAQIVAKLNKLKEYETVGTVKEFKYLRQSEHNYDNCHNYTCRMKCEKNGYTKAIEEFAERFIYTAICEGCSGCANCHETGSQYRCDHYRYYMQIAEELKGNKAAEEKEG